MSGHSKWATTHRQKEATDAKRGVLFTKLGKAITIAARLGGGDPTANFRLRLAIDQARAASMPKENIERAIKRGTGELAGEKIEAITYEGFGPEGVAFLIDCLSDNRNRTSSTLKHLLSEYGGSLGSPNSVARLFEQKGVIRTEKVDDGLELELIDAGAQDIVSEDNGFTIYTGPADLKKIKDLLESKSIAVQYSETEQVPKDKMPVSPESKEKIEQLFVELDNNEDVSNYYTNAEI